MGANRKAFHRGVGEAQAEAIIKYVVAMDDNVFDNWLMLVVTKRADVGSDRAKEMLALELANRDE